MSTSFRNRCSTTIWPTPAIGLPLPVYALLETIGRKTGKPRGRRWAMNTSTTQLQSMGAKAGYFLNMQHNPRVRLKLPEVVETSLASEYRSSASQR
ncbi:MAG TPA: nitroreductase/quinone reductase family protein [Terriglobales bacterium]|nr:nitroreductase/quinone reductase family protein [Terriglobales bacterium]